MTTLNAFVDQAFSLVEPHHYPYRLHTAPYIGKRLQVFRDSQLVSMLALTHYYSPAETFICTDVVLYHELPEAVQRRQKEFLAQFDTLLILALRDVTWTIVPRAGGYCAMLSVHAIGLANEP